MSLPLGLSHRLTDMKKMKLYNSSTCDYVTLKHLLWQNKEILSVWWLRYIKEGLAEAAFSQKVETALVILEMKHAEELLNQNYRSSPEPFFFANMIIKPPKKLWAMDGWTASLEPVMQTGLMHRWGLNRDQKLQACSSSCWKVLLAGCQEHCWEPLYIFNTYHKSFTIFPVRHIFDSYEMYRICIVRRILLGPSRPVRVLKTLDFMKSKTKEHITTFSQVLLFYLSEKHFFPKPKHTVMKWNVSEGQTLKKAATKSVWYFSTLVTLVCNPWKENKQSHLYLEGPTFFLNWEILRVQSYACIRDVVVLPVVGRVCCISLG